MTNFNGPIVFKLGSSEEPTCFHGIRQTTQTQCECGCKDVELLGLAQDTDDGNVDLHDGEFKLHSVDLERVLKAPYKKPCSRVPLYAFVRSHCRPINHGLFGSGK